MEPFGQLFVLHREFVKAELHSAINQHWEEFFIGNHAAHLSMELKAGTDNFFTEILTKWMAIITRVLIGMEMSYSHHLIAFSNNAISDYNVKLTLISFRIVQKS